MASRVVIGYDGSAASGTRSRSGDLVPLCRRRADRRDCVSGGAPVRDWARRRRVGHLHSSRPVVGALFLPGRQDGRACFLGQGRDSFGKALEFAAAGGTARARAQTALLGERSWSRWLRWAPTMSTSSLWLPRLWPSAPGPARSSLVAADSTCPAAGSCRAAGRTA